MSSGDRCPAIHEGTGGQCLYDHGHNGDHRAGKNDKSYDVEWATVINPAHVRLLRFFKYEHLKSAMLKKVSQPFCELARNLAATPSHDPAELTVALRKLLEAKDAAVRSFLND